MAAPYIERGGEDHQPNRNRSHRSARRGSCIGRIEHAPPQLSLSLKDKLAPPALDSTPRRPRRTMSPARSETASTTAVGEVPGPVDDACYGYEDMNLKQDVSECTQSSREMLESTRRKTGRRGSALGRLQQLQIMESDKYSDEQEDSNERARSTFGDLFQSTTRRHHSAAAADRKWSASTIRETDPVSPSNRCRMSVGDFVKNWRTNHDGRANLDITGRSSHSNPDANRERKSSNKHSDRNIRGSRSSMDQDARANLDINGRSSHSNPDRERRNGNKHSDRNVRDSRSSTDPSTWSSRSNPDTGAQNSRHSLDSSTPRRSPRSSRSSPDLPVCDSHRVRVGRKKIDHRGNALIGQRQDGWNGQAPNQTPDTLTLDRLQGLAQMKLVRDQSKMSLMSKESALSKESSILSRDSQANRDYGIPWWS
jgi:hypothetical protein